ncbi:transporter substrate-binding domain-containing protein [uncultured Pseudodesulfovibrio sp.]|uniref:substrate-binding periplasmic protein n=1 Tax=uncultured Pseudodesulfovibrio sp. TaxID=2035858 RepID=UPI0029C722B6|nr:transporter substrate-binding domain-containing protein [uncultured Pseudodesulfovibrio sp.]
MLRIGTMELQPYGWVDKKGNKHGSLYALHEEVGKRYGGSYSNEIIPFVRMFEMLQQGELDMISSQPHAAAMRAGDKLAVQYLNRVVVATRRDSGVRNLDDLEGRTVLVHAGASYVELDDINFQVHYMQNYRMMLEVLFLRAGIAAAVFSEPAYYYWMYMLGLSPDDFGNVVILSEDKEQWAFVRKGLAPAVRDKLKRIVNAIRKEKVYERLLSDMRKKAESNISRGR